MPKTYNNLWEKIIDFENIFLAFKEARKGKRYKNEVLEFSNDLESNLISIQNELIWDKWKPGRWREFFVYDPKKRLIQAPPFKDRVVHHALVRIIEPLFERKFIYDSYACRGGKGTHKAMKRCVKFLRIIKRNHGKVYVLKADISKYFPSINRNMLTQIIQRTIRCKKTLKLIEKIINIDNEPKGIPIGALTSQLFANIYLDRLDYFVKDFLGVKYYIRYMDDFVILSHDKNYLKELYIEINNFLEFELNLKLNPKTNIFPYKQGINFCGYRIWPTHILPRKRNIKKMRKRLKYLSKLYRKRKITLNEFKSSLMSYLGYLKHCNSYTTLKSILNEIYLM